MNKFTTMLKNLLGLTELSTKDGKPDLTQEQQNSLQNQIGAEDMATLIEQVTGELAGVQDARTQLAEARTTLETVTTTSQEQASLISALEGRLQAAQAEATTLRDQVATLSDQPDTNAPVASNFAQFQGAAGSVLRKVQAVGNQLMGYEGDFWAMDRPWNARAVGGAKASATDFTNQVVIDRLNGDMEDFIRENPSTIDDIFNQYFNLPEQWKANTIFGVADRMTTATILTEEVTQPRKDVWMPKGAAHILPEEMRIRPVQMDLQWNYSKLVVIEYNWMNSFNREGTQAYKMHFIQYLVSFYLKQARSEDANVLVQGVFVPTPEGYEHPVSYLYRNDGVVKILFDARDKKYRPFNIGLPTEANICDYIDNDLIGSIDPEVRNQPLELALSPFWIRAYKKRDELNRGQNNNYEGYPKTPRDYPNIEFVPVTQFEGTDIMFITVPGNVTPLEYKPEEKSLLTFEKFLRNVYAFADYRLGIGLKHIGVATQPNDPQRFLKQVVWSNNTPLFKKDFYVNIYDNKTGIVEVFHNRVKLAEEFTTDITKITGNVGQFLYIKGDISLASSVKVKKNTDLKLTADFDLKSGGLLTLVKNSDGTYTEVTRTTAPEIESNAIEFKTATIDYKDSTEFVFAGAAASLTDIVGGVEGNTIRIHGGADTAHALTIATVAGKIKANSSYVLDTNAKYMDLIFVEGLWVEYGRG